MEPNEPLTELTTPELERLVREKQGDKIQRYEYVTGKGFIADRAVTHTFAVPLEPEDFTEENAHFTDTEWLALLNGLHPALIMDVLEYAKILHGKTEDSAGDLLKRATLIAYLEHAEETISARK